MSNLGVMRDKFGNSEVFKQRQERLEGRHLKMPFQFYVDKFQTEKRITPEGAKDLSLITGTFLRRVIESIQLEYSMGRELSELNECFGVELIKRFKFVSNVLSEGHPKKYIFTYVGQDLQCNSLHTIYCVLAWLLCLGCTKDDLQIIAPYLGQAGKDRLLDIICRYFHVDRDVANESAHPAAFGLLDKLVMADAAQRPELVKLYLEEWPKTVEFIGGGSIGLCCHVRAGQVRNKSDMLKGIDTEYLGYWALEAALAVKFFNIDDSSFKDHDFYPYDLVNFLPPLDNHDYIKSLNSDDAARVSASSNRVARRDDLVVSMCDGFAEVERQLKEGEKLQNRHEFYQAFKLKEPVSDQSSADPVLDSSVRYSVYVLSDADEVYEDAGCIELAMAMEGEFTPSIHDSMTLHQLVDEYGESESFPFMDEVHLYMSGDKTEGEYVYCSRHKENQVPPLLILRYRKQLGEQMLCIDCMVRDDALMVSDVKPHWEWLVDNYRIN